MRHELHIFCLEHPVCYRLKLQENQTKLTRKEPVNLTFGLSILWKTWP